MSAGPSNGGAFIPDSDQTITGNWTFSTVPTYTGLGTQVSTTATQTLTNKTLTSPTINTPTIATPTITAGSIAGATTISAAIHGDTKVLAADVTYTSNTTLATLTGFSWTLVAGATYLFDINLPTTMTTTGGLSVALTLTTATLTSIQMQTYAATATDNSTAVSTQSTTTTSATKFFDSKTAAYTLVTLKGSLVVGTGGTIAVQAAQNTSASGGDVSTVKLGATATFTRAA
jgi:hypothetical protein